MNGNGYTIVQAGAEAPAEEFVRRYVDLKDPTAGCRPCPDYWGRYETVLLRGMQFHFTRELLERRFTPEELAEYTRELTAAHARRMDGHLRALYPGAAVLTTGGCMLCAACTRPAGRPCRHPEAVGYSLESLGCDVGAAARGELGWELLWPRRDKLPRYLTLLCAVLR